jgi:rare lipoprotein A
MIRKFLLAIAVLILIVGCSTRHTKSQNYKSSNSSGNSKNYSKSYNSSGNGKKYSHPTMRPYVIDGKRYYPTVVSVGTTIDGRASWYGPNFHGKLTSNGETYNMWAMTAAHKTLPMNTIVRVTNHSNNKSTIVRINDRGPFVNSRIIDLSKKAASNIDMIATGTAPVTLEILGFEKKGSTKIPTEKEMKDGPKQKIIGSFAIQVASFSKIEGAIATQEKYDGIGGYKTIIKDIGEGDARLFKIYFTGFQSEEEAIDFLNSDHINSGFIIRE